MNLSKTRKLFTLILTWTLFTAPLANAGVLSCSVAATCTAPDVTVMKLYRTSGGHAELSSGSTYTNLVCCTGITGLGNSCSGTYDEVLQLSATTNAHVEQNSQANYGQSACLSVSTGTVTVAYQSTNCTGYDTTVASISGVTNAHAGNSSAYTTKVCATVGSAQTLSFSISGNSIGFGTLSTSAARYANSAGTGSSSETEAHTLTASTNATSGYIITVQGATLKQGTATIDAIGATNTASSTGTEQFGLRASVTSGTGTVSSPYAASGFAYAATSSTPSTVATGSGSGSSTVFSVRYLSNISTTTEAGAYSTTLNFVATGQF